MEEVPRRASLVPLAFPCFVPRLIGVETEALLVYQGRAGIDSVVRWKLAKFSAKLVANFRRSLEGDFRASFAGGNRQKHFPPKLFRKFHHQTSLRGSGLWQAL